MWWELRSQLGCQKWWHQPPPLDDGCLFFKPMQRGHSSPVITNNPERPLFMSPLPYLLKVFLGFAVLQFAGIFARLTQLQTHPTVETKARNLLFQTPPKICKTCDRSRGTVHWFPRNGVLDPLSFLVGRARLCCWQQVLFDGSCPVLGFRARFNIWSPLWPEQKCMLVDDWWLWAGRRGWGGERRDGGRPTRGE